ncbi:MAG TPA: DUF973 family protein [Thermoplasmata archaeon]|nr:DUF973 family protein [Thermoplasmata archaeon]
MSSALSSLQIAGLLGLLGGIAGAISAAYFATTNALTPATTSTSSGTLRFTINTGVVEEVLVIGAAAAVLELVTLCYYLSAFRALRQTDPGFETPARLIWLAIIGLPFLFLGVAYLFESLIALANCSNGLPATGNIESSCGSQLAGVLAAAGVFLLVAIIAFIGWITFLVGVWRLGSLFDEGAFKAAAVLFLIPYVSMIGSLLVWYCARKQSQNPRIRLRFTV